MNKFIILFVMVYLPAILIAQPGKYAVSAIPDSLSDDADAVVRESKTIFEIKSPGKAVEEKLFVITILKKKAIRYSVFQKRHTDLLKIKNIECTILDDNGEKIRKISSDEIHDYSAISNSSLYSDNRVMAFDPEIDDVPFTVVLSYERKYDGLLHYPHWEPFPGVDVSVEESVFELHVPKNQIVRYSANGEQIHFEKDESNSDMIYRWKLANATPIKYEPFTIPFTDIVPKVKLAPAQFEIEGYVGDQSTWKSFGKWISALMNGTDELPDEMVQKTKELTSGLQTEREKIEAIYDFLQSNTRYLNIAVGIGGWKPKDVKLTAKHGIGDCKALSNYFVALLEAAGIESYYALVYSDDHPPKLQNEFPSNQFNHVIVAIPQKNDTLWVETTNQHYPLNHWHNSIDGRYALLIKEDGGELVKTPAYTKKQNLATQTVNFDLAETGGGEVQVDGRYTGAFFDDFAALVYSSNEKEKEKYLYRLISIPDFVINQFKYTEKESDIAAIDESLELKVNNYASKMGNMLFLPLNVLSKIETLPEKSEERLQDLYFRQSKIMVDTVNFNLPDGFTPRQLPDEVSLQCKCASYKAVAKYNDGMLQYIRRMEIDAGRYEPETFNEFHEFLTLVIKADKNKVVLQKQ